MDLSLRAMRYVQMALNKGSIAAAAAELNVAASAVSAALDQAEVAFGLALATRARARGISPTSAGRVILQRIDDLLDHYQSVLLNGAELQGALTGLMKIGYYAPVAPAFLPQILRQMSAENPGLRFDLHDCDNVQAQAGLLDGRFDAILFVADRPVPQIAVTRLIHAPSYCLCPSSHPFAQRASVTLAEVARQDLILLDRPVATAFYRDLLERGGHSLTLIATANSTEMVRALVGAGMGCSVLNMRPRTPHSFAGDAVVPVPISDNSSGLTLSLGTPVGATRRLVQEFCAACESYFATDAAKDLIVLP